MPTIPTPDGSTLIFATVGDPVGQVVAPTLMSGRLATIGRNAIWLPIAADSDALPSVLDAVRHWRNFAGLTVTVPHKAAALELVDAVTRRAQASGGINMVRREADGRLFGDMVDGVGFVTGLAARGFDVAGRSAMLVGAGGAGAAIAAALGEAGLARLQVVDPDAGRVAALEQRLARYYSAMRIASGVDPQVDLAINATPLGMRADDPLPFDPATLPSHVLVCDIIMHPAETALLARAAALGYATQPGRPMLDHQADLYLEFFGMGDASV